MDNVFEILIYLFIIISFISSFFKKKKQQQKPPARQQPVDENYQTEVPTPQTQTKEDYDILTELEDFFKVGGESARGSESVSQQQTETTPTMEKHVKTDSWHAPTESEHVVDRWERKKSEVKEILAGVDSAIEQKAALFEKSLDKKESVYSTLALAVKSKMKNPSTLKEYIIFSEILGKPKALRR
jgi:hypothetical protein